MRQLRKSIFTLAILICAWFDSGAMTNQPRNRGETFFQCMNSNVPGPGNIWITLQGITHVWDDSRIDLDTINSTTPPSRTWTSNVREFPEVYLQAGMTDFFSLHAASRPLGYGFRPGWFSGGMKLTWPNNQDLRLHGAALSFNYLYHNRENAPTLGGYNGFMPEGFVVKGHTIETVAVYELDLISRVSRLPLRVMVNAGVRMPLSKRRELFQTLMDAGVVYGGHGFDFFLEYSLEAFNNLLSPMEIEDDLTGKRFLVWFSENLMYLTLGGNVRYKNGMTVSLAIPVLLSVNQGSRMRTDDLVELNRLEHPEDFVYEKKHDIRDPFDPWFTKWKVALSVSFPLNFHMTGAEMMRNYLILKNRKNAKTINIDNQLQNDSGKTKDDNTDKEDAKRRLDAIRKKREMLLE